MGLDVGLLGAFPRGEKDFCGLSQWPRWIVPASAEWGESAALLAGKFCLLGSAA